MEVKTKNKAEKIPFKKPEQVRAEKHQSIMDSIIAQTFARHSKIEEKEYLEKIGFKDIEISEEKAVRSATFNVLVALTKEILSIENKINMANGILRTYLLDEGIAEQETEKESEQKKQEKNEKGE